jgi:hypothetical protein
MIEQLVSKAFFSRNLAHLEHWRTQNGEVHRALGEFYEGVISTVDDVVECYQGTYGLIGPVPVITTVEASTITDHLVVERDWIKQNKTAITGGDDAIGNLVDTVTGLYSKTIYKLQNLH